jgi:Domain of unknown function (DUF397)
MTIASGTPGGQVAVTWRKARAGNPGGSCLEVAALPGGDVAVRDSRHPSGPALACTRAEIAEFAAGTGNGEFVDLG